MNRSAVINSFLKYNLLVWLLCCNLFASAQTIKYSSENVFIENPDIIRLVNINSGYHLVTFTNRVRPQIFMFDGDLELKSHVKTPYKFPEKSQLMIIPFRNYYYILLLPYYDTKYIFWKVDENGNVKDMSEAFRKIARPSRQKTFPFQLISHQDNLYMITHGYGREGVGQTNIARLDTTLNIVFTNKVAYKLKMGDSQLQQEMLVNGNTLYILKTLSYARELAIMKVNLDNGDIISNNYTSTFLYSEPRFTYNEKDSSIIISSVLKQPGTGVDLKKYVFISSLNNSLAEITPFSILRSQFLSNANVNFLSVKGLPWIVFRGGLLPYSYYDVQNPFPNQMDSFYRALRMPSISSTRYYTDFGKQPVRISLFDKDFKLRQDSLIQNNKNSYTLVTDQYTAFSSRDQHYLLIIQKFFKKSTGLLMINENDNDNSLSFTDIRVSNRNEYLMSQSKRVKNGVVIPYKHKREAGLVRVSVE